MRSLLSGTYHTPRDFGMFISDQHSIALSEEFACAMYQAEFDFHDSDPVDFPWSYMSL